MAEPGDRSGRTASRLTLRIDLPNGSRLGPGKVGLLEAVARHRSIAAAAREHGMSYRRAWLLIDDMNRAFAEPLVDTFPGRSHGDGAALTALGVRMVAAYRTAERRAVKAAGVAVAEIEAACKGDYAGEKINSSRRKPAARA